MPLDLEKQEPISGSCFSSNHTGGQATRSLMAVLNDGGDYARDTFGKDHNRRA